VNVRVRVSCPNWERSSSPTSAENREGENEHHNLRTTVQRRGDNIVVLDEELGPLPAEIELREESDGEEGQKR